MFFHQRQTLTHDIALGLRRWRYGSPDTKVFCIGFQKTGTTSLQYALSLMGYRVAGVMNANQYDGPDALHAEALRLLPKFDAFADNPWPIYFKEFDRIYPNSKFILTSRDPEQWYVSVCRHFGSERSKMREWIYGAGSPFDNKAAYVDRVAGHQAAVRAYFADRPGDLLEFNVSAGHGWSELCEFLKRPAPNRCFPKLNTAAMRT